MKIVTSWQREGREEGREEGRKGMLDVALFLLASQLGDLPPLLSYQIQGLNLFQLKQLSKQVLTFKTAEMLASRLNELEALEGFEAEKASILAQLRQQVGAIAPKQKQKLLTLSTPQWHTLKTLKLENIDALDSWLSSNSH